MAKLAAAATMILALAFAAPAIAQTCRGPAPAVGATVTGPVLHVIDGQTLCIAQGPTPDHWIPLTITARLTSMPVDRERLMAAAFSQSLTCQVTGDRGATRSATCTLGGRSLDSLMTDPATLIQAKTWR